MLKWNKSYASMWTGSMRGKPSLLLVWRWMLDHQTNGIVDAVPQVIADDTGLTLPVVHKALDALEAADPDSRTPVEGGRRIVRLDSHRTWGWRIVNHEKYQGISRAPYHRDYYQRRKAQQPSTPVNTSQQLRTVVNPLEVEVEGEGEKKGGGGESTTLCERDTSTRLRTSARASRTPRAPFSAPSLEDVKAYCGERRNAVDPQAWLDHYTANGWRVGRNPMRDWRAAVRTWERNGVSNGKPAVQESKPDRSTLERVKRERREWEATHGKGGNDA